MKCSISLEISIPQGDLDFCFNPWALSWGAEKVPQRNCVTKILPNVRVNFLVRFASKPLFDWVMTGNPLELFRHFFGAVRAIFGLCESLLAPDLDREKLNRGVSKPGGFPLFYRERSRLCRGPFRDCSSYVLLVGRKRDKGRIRKMPGPSPSKSGKSRKNRESPKKNEKGQKGQKKSRSGNPPPFETTPP